MLVHWKILTENINDRILIIIFLFEIATYVIRLLNFNVLFWDALFSLPKSGQ